MLAGGDEQILKTLKTFLDKEKIEYQESRFLFGTSWDEGVTLSLKTRVVILGNFITDMEIHNGIKFYRKDKMYETNPFLFKLDITKSNLLEEILN